MRLAERDEPEATRKNWKIMIGDTNSRGNLSACFGSRIRAKDVGAIRSQTVAGKKLDQRGGDCAAGEKLAGGVAVQ